MRFLAAGSDDIDPGDYALPYQTISMILLGPGASVTHDALRILARHGTLFLAAIGEGGVNPPHTRGSTWQLKPFKVSEKWLKGHLESKLPESFVLLLGETIAGAFLLRSLPLSRHLLESLNPVDIDGPR